MVAVATGGNNGPLPGTAARGGERVNWSSLWTGSCAWPAGRGCCTARPGGASLTGGCSGRGGYRGLRGQKIKLKQLSFSQTPFLHLTLLLVTAADSTAAEAAVADGAAAAPRLQPPSAGRPPPRPRSPSMTAGFFVQKELLVFRCCHVSASAVVMPPPRFRSTPRCPPSPATATAAIVVSSAFVAPLRCNSPSTTADHDLGCRRGC